ncbi:glucose-6-phosphate isomerase [Candidatus Peregrinibacteria bacterium]|nr:glucose-6-phosphate isomerase [Candidatus Peregrinibacteria bacterium]
MIRLDDTESTIADINLYQDRIGPYLEAIRQKNQGFHTIIDDTKTLDDIMQFVRSVEGRYTHIVVLGIGGSALGTLCLQQSLTPLYRAHPHNSHHPHLYVLDNIDPALLQETLEVIDLKKTLFIVVSKSGKTPETIAQYSFFRKQTDNADLPASKHFVFITDKKKGLLRTISDKEAIPSFIIPDNVGGRFSVLTPVGLLPAALIGIDINKLIRGAHTMRDIFYTDDIEKNIPFRVAALQYALSKKGKSITVMMPYAQKLERFADWYRQLLAESIGKAHDNDGNTVNVGLTPVKALGVTDQHSQSQLYNEGPNDKFFMFLSVQDFGTDMNIPVIHDDPSIDYLRDVSFATLMHTEQKGTQQSLIENKRPLITISIDTINEEYIGGLFMLFECATAFLGEFYSINAFDQPGVELSKVITKKLLT